MLKWRVDPKKNLKMARRPITMAQKLVLMRHTRMPLSKIHAMSIDEARREIGLLVDGWWCGRRRVAYLPDELYWGDVDEADKYGAGPEF